MPNTALVDAPMMLLSLEAALLCEELPARSGKLSSSSVPPIQRSSSSAALKLDFEAKRYLSDISSSLHEQFHPSSSTSKLVEFPLLSLQVEKLNIPLRHPGALHQAPHIKSSDTISMDVDSLSSLASKPSSTFSPSASEKSTTVKFVPTSESTLAKKKPRMTNYGVTPKFEDMDILKDDDLSISTQAKDSGFKTARQQLDENNARDGKPALAPSKDSNDKKRPRKVVIEDLVDGVDEDGDLSITAKKRAPLMTQVTGSLLSRFSPLPSSSTSHSNGKASTNGVGANGSKSGKSTSVPSSSNSSNINNGKSNINGNSSSSNGTNIVSDKKSTSSAEVEVYKGIDPEIAERVLNEILDTNMNVKWTDIAGLEDVKETLREMIILPNLHPEMFTGLRAPPRGLLLFGPPGNGKTMIAKAIATEAGLTFFSISASVLCSKWIGEGEKTMRALFTIARAKAPSFIFIDEVDSILCSRSSEEHESSRRLKNEFLTQFDGATSSPDDAVTIMGATNRPFDLDDAARRRMPKRIYVPLPEQATRYNLLSNLLKGENHSLLIEEIEYISQRLEGYSCSDIHQLSQQAAMGPVRDKMKSGLMTGALRAINVQDFHKAIDSTRPSVAPEECKLYADFSDKFGTKGL